MPKAIRAPGKRVRGKTEAKRVRVDRAPSRPRRPAKIAIESHGPRGGAARATVDEQTLDLTIRLEGVSPIALPWPRIAHDAMVLSYVVRNRRRWSGESDLGATEDSPLPRLLGPTVLRQIADAGLVEISVPWSDARGDAWGWPARLMPWEFLLSSATSTYRRGRPLTVVRRLQGTTRRALHGPSEKPLIVASLPGALERLIDLKAETKLVRTSLGIRDADRDAVVATPDLQRLREAVRLRQPGLIHFAGLDNHQAAELLGRTEKRGEEESREQEQDPSRLDGLALLGADRAVDYVPAAYASSALLAGATAPTLVSLNVYNSAARIAPRLIVDGAAHAIGFQDTIDDRLAEQFFAVFYAKLREDPSAMLAAFRFALDVLRQSPERLRGACIVLWSAESLVKVVRPPKRVRAAPVVRRVTAESTADCREWLDVFCEPNAEMNYSLLHNNRSPLKRLQIQRRVAGAIPDVNVSVTLFVGQESFPFVRTLTLPEGQEMVDLTRDVKVPLTSSLIRTQSEKVRSVIQVRVAIGETVVHSNTYPMTLAPVDEWTDTDANRLWLPSFVLPRDPAVGALVQSAQRYLVAIQDDPAAGFDGYQSVGRADLPFAERYAPIDKQVRALWYALLVDKPVTYINPPPSYTNPQGRRTESPQRLRTPSEIMQTRHGTCIDLALLLCACLEYVDIWPVMFLLNGHAFPGYWRSEELHRRFQSFANAKDVGGGDIRGGVSSDSNESAYTVPATGYLEVKALVDRGDLVPLEAVWLTNLSSFEDSQSEGLKNLRSRREFASMVDIKRARDEGIVPLPMLWQRP